MNQDSVDYQRPDYLRLKDFDAYETFTDFSSAVGSDLYENKTQEIKETTLELCGQQFKVQKTLYQRQESKVLLVRKNQDKNNIIVKVTEVPENGSSASIHLTYQMQFYKKIKPIQTTHLITINHVVQTRKQVIRLMEFACRGNLTQYIPLSSQYTQKDKKMNHLENVKNILWQVIKGLEEVHNLGYAFIDLKPSNVLISHNGTIKLCDFGLVIPLGVIDTSICGTPQYMAPERLSAKRTNTPIDSTVDLWSLGVLAYQLLMGYPPYFYEEGDIESLLQSMYGGYISFDQQLSSQCKHFIFNLLQTNPARRMKLDQVKQHSFFKNFQEQALVNNECKCQNNNF